jgi:4'-phosphopantetheinyl transferase
VTRAVPPGDLVDVWWFDTRAVTVGPAGRAELDQGERDRAEAFLFPADRHRYQVAHVMLRRVLAGYTGIPPGTLRLARALCPHCGAPGKPVLEPGAHTVPSFSLTHSGDQVVIAVAGRPVGVDVEHGAARCVCSLAQALHPADAAWVAGLAPAGPVVSAGRGRGEGGGHDGGFRDRRVPDPGREDQGLAGPGPPRPPDRRHDRRAAGPQPLA